MPFFLAPSFTSSVLSEGQSIVYNIIPVINTAQLFGRVLPLWASDHRRHDFLGPELCILGFSWIAFHSLGGFTLWSILYGFFSGMAFTMPAIILPYICPNMSVYGTRLGMLYAVSGLGLLISAPVAAAANSSTKGFLGSQIWTGTCCLVTSLLFVINGVEVRKRRLLSTRRRRFTKTDGSPPSRGEKLTQLVALAI